MVITEYHDKIDYYSSNKISCDQARGMCMLPSNNNYYRHGVQKQTTVELRQICYPQALFYQLIESDKSGLQSSFCVQNSMCYHDQHLLHSAGGGGGGGRAGER